jgi:hypothetical protein
MSWLERLSTGQVASVERPTLAFPVPEATSQGIDRMDATGRSGRRIASAVIRFLRVIGSTDMAKRAPIDHKLELKMILLRFANGQMAEARAEGNNAAWTCECSMLLVGRCYYQFGDTCHTECPSCHRLYRVTSDQRKRAVGVVEDAA